MEKKIEIFVYDYWDMNDGVCCYPISLSQLLGGTEIPLFDSEAEAVIWYNSFYKSEKSRIDTMNQEALKNHKPGLFSGTPDKLKFDHPKQIHLRECWVINE